jgi:L-alanine-DL-glutamate epimerase-like enolase superfamily enzyme
MAGWDIYGKMKRKQLHEIWGLGLAQTPVTDFTIGIDSIEKMVAKVKENPWPIYKIKVGFDGDLETISELRKHTDSVFRVDANEGWDLETALHKIPHLHDLGIELVEQPLAKENWEDMKILFEQSSIPLFADESCVHETDVDKCKGFFHGINIKLTKCSGITPARRMIQNARSQDLKVMMGCMNESTIGTAAIAQLAALVDYIDNDGTLLQTAQVGTGITFDNGKMNYGTTSGLGVNVEGGNGG